MLPENRVPTHPGAILRDHFLKPLELTQVGRAGHLGIPVQRINEIVRISLLFLAMVTWPSIAEATSDGCVSEVGRGLDPRDYDIVVAGVIIANVPDSDHTSLKVEDPWSQETYPVIAVTVQPGIIRKSRPRWRVRAPDPRRSADLAISFEGRCLG